MVKQAKKSRRSSTTAVPATPAAALLSQPHEDSGPSSEPATRQVAQVLAQHLGKHLPQEALLSSRLVCKEWSKALPTGRKHIVIEQPRSGSLACVPAIFEAVEDVSFIISERLTPVAVQSRMLELFNDEFCGRVKHLSFTSTSPQGSKLSGWPYGMPYWPLQLVDIKGLESLTFIGRAPQLSLVDEIVANCTRLTSLVLGTKPGDHLTPLSPDSSTRLVCRRGCFTALSKLTSLRRLALTVDDRLWQEEAEVASAPAKAVAALTGLTELRLAGGAVSIEAARSMLRPLKQLRHVSLALKGPSGRLYERADRSLWKTLEAVELQLRSRVLEGDLQLLTLGLAANLRSLHLRDCFVTSYSVAALSALGALRELSLDAWTPLGPTGLPAGYEVHLPIGGAAAVSEGIRIALAGLLAGPVGRQLEVLRMDLSGPSKDICGDMARIAQSAWSQDPPLRVLQLVNVSSYSLASSGALACLSTLQGLQELRVTVQGPPCREGSSLRTAWLPANLTSLELAGVNLPCPAEEEAQQQGLQLEQQQPDNEHTGGTGCAPSQRSEQPQPPLQRQAAGRQEEVTGGGSGVGQLKQMRRQRLPIPGPAPAAAAADEAGSAGSGFEGAAGIQGGATRSPVPGGHHRLRNLKRLSVHGCKYGCCGHLEAALGPAVASHLVSLELDDVAGLQEAHLTGLAALTGLTSLAVCALGQPDIGSSSMAHVSGLTALRRLKWHAGDSLDAPPHPAVLKPLRRLAVLDVSMGQWMRMSRWHVASALAEELPVCELAAN